MTFGYITGRTGELILRMIWLCWVRIFLDYKFAYSSDSHCTELLDVFSSADALHIKYPLEPITKYATKQEINQYWYRLGLICITEIGEAQAMMEMNKNEYLTSLQEISTDIVQMHMDQEFWYQQHTLDSNAHHLVNHMIDMVQQYMRGDETRMETHIELGSLVYEYKQCKGIFAQSKLTMDAIPSKHADFYKLPDDTWKDTSAKSQAPGEGHNRWFWAITADHIVDLEFGGDWYPVHQPEDPTYVWQGSAISRLRDWAGGGDHHLRRCDYQIEHQPSHSEGVLNRNIR